MNSSYYKNETMSIVAYLVFESIVDSFTYFHGKYF